MKTTPRNIFATGSLVAALSLGIAGCDHPPRPPTIGTVRAFVTILPQAYFVERIGGSHVTVGVMVGPGQSFHSYEPTPKQIADLAEAQVYFTVGVPFERTLIDKIRATNPHLVVVDTREGIKLRPSSEHDEDSHGHGEEGDPHIWLDPMLVKIQARTIQEALSRLDPDHAADYEIHCREFQGDLDETNARITSELAPFKGREFFVFHPSFGYFGDAYGLKEVPVEEGGKEPGGSELARMIKRARSAGATTIFVQPEFASKSAETVAIEIGANVVTLDPLARNYLNNLGDMANKIAVSLRLADNRANDRMTKAGP